MREWLGAMVTGGVVEYDPARRSYALPAEHAAFPAAPTPERLVELGWERVGSGPSQAWTLGPVAGFDAGVRSLSTRVVDTLQEFACPLGFVDLRLRQVASSSSGPDQ